MSFDRPHYLEPVLHSLKAQTARIRPDQVFMFQDGYRSKTGRDLTDPLLIEKCVTLFESTFPGSKAFVATENLGVAENFARAENFFFRDLRADAAYFFEDDLVLSPHYLTALDALTDLALRENRIAYVAAYGDHRARAEDQKRTPKKLIPMRHKWGFALTQRQWGAQRELIEPYLEIVRRADYRSRDHAAIRDYFRKLGYGSTGTSQDAMKDVASCVLGTTKIQTFPCFGKYIGAIGLHSTIKLYDEEAFARTELYPEPISSFEMPDSALLDRWIAQSRTNAREHASTTGTSANLLPRGPAVSDDDRDPPGQNGNTTAAEDERFVRALYRVLLAREADPIGLRSGLRQLQRTKSYEEVMIWCLRSREFSEKAAQFIRRYVQTENAHAAAIGSQSDSPGDGQSGDSALIDVDRISTKGRSG